ncbi:MAG TPA: hypothetical protein VGH27_24170 [Streptosporangiaceae bacterium]|jgi:hypothetical protein
MPFAAPAEARPVSPRVKRVLLSAGLVLAVVVVGTIVWSAFNPGGSGTSKNGCISVTLASSTGGSTIHQCGAAAKATCRNAFTHGDRISMLTRPQCRLAGLVP